MAKFEFEVPICTRGAGGGKSPHIGATAFAQANAYRGVVNAFTSVRSLRHGLTCAVTFAAHGALKSPLE